jgi:hypothetical protein
VLKQGENNKFEVGTFILLKKKKKNGRYFQDVAPFKGTVRRKLRWVKIGINQ